MSRAIIDFPDVRAGDVLPKTAQHGGPHSAELAGWWREPEAACSPPPSRYTLDAHFHHTHARTPFTDAFLSDTNTVAVLESFTRAVTKSQGMAGLLYSPLDATAARVGRPVDGSFSRPVGGYIPAQSTPYFASLVLSAAAKYAALPASAVSEVNAQIVAQGAANGAADVVANAQYASFLEHGRTHDAELPGFSRGGEVEEHKLRKSGEGTFLDAYHVTGSDGIGYDRWMAGEERILQLDPPSLDDESGFY